MLNFINLFSWNILEWAVLLNEELAVLNQNVDLSKRIQRLLKYNIQKDIMQQKQKKSIFDVFTKTFSRLKSQRKMWGFFLSTTDFFQGLKASLDHVAAHQTKTAK